VQRHASTHFVFHDIAGMIGLGLLTLTQSLVPSLCGARPVSRRLEHEHHRSSRYGGTAMIVPRPHCVGGLHPPYEASVSGLLLLSSEKFPGGSARSNNAAGGAPVIVRRGLRWRASRVPTRLRYPGYACYPSGRGGVAWLGGRTKCPA
jgi:hypothetical protein